MNPDTPNVELPTANATRPPLSIAAAALILLVGSLVTFLGSIWYLRKAYAGSMSQFLLYAHSFSIALLDLLAILLVVFGLLGIVTSIGLLYLREPARKAAIFLSTVFTRDKVRSQFR